MCRGCLPWRLRELGTMQVFVVDRGIPSSCASSYLPGEAELLACIPSPSITANEPLVLDTLQCPPLNLEVETCQGRLQWL